MADTIPGVRRRRGLAMVAALLGLAVIPSPLSAPAQAPAPPSAPTPGAVSATALAPLSPPAPAAAPALAPPDRQGRSCGDFPPDSPQACSGRPLDYNPRIRIALHTVALLPGGRQGQPYRPTIVVRGGVPDYDVERQTGLPPGMMVTPTGLLEGTPTKAGPYLLRLVVRDSASPPNEIRGDYSLRILGPLRVVAKGPPPPPPQPPAPPPPARRAPPGVMIVYELTQADLKALDALELTVQVAAPPATSPPATSPPPTARSRTSPPTTAPATSPPPTSAPPTTPAPSPASPPPNQAVSAAPSGQGAATATPTVAAPPPSLVRRATPPLPATPASTAIPQTSPEPLSSLLGSLMNIEYPNRFLFDSAIRHLLPVGTYTANEETIAEHAAKREEFYNARPLHWEGEHNCNCVHPQPKDYHRVVYGFFPFWRSTLPKQTIKFSLFDRIGFLGAQLADNGAWITPSNGKLPENEWWQDTSEFSRAAHSHGTHLDLVLQRRDWSFLDDLSVLSGQALGEAAAIRAVRLVDTPLTDSAAFARWFLWGMWPKPTHVFDGVTVMFDPPTGDVREQAAFANFFDSFMLALIHEMQKNKRAYNINIVMSDTMICNRDTAHPICNPGVFALANLMRYKHSAEPAKQKLALSQEERRYYYGRTPIAVRFLVTIHDPQRASQDELRRSIDAMNDSPGEFDFTGPARSTLLQSIIPVVFYPAGAPSNKLFEPTRLDYGIAYFAQNFGGAGVWPTPVDDVDGAPTVDKAIKHNYLLEGLKICSTGLRLIWQLGVILVPVFAFLYFFMDASRRTRLIYLLGLAASGLVAVVLGLVLLELDPALNVISEGNLILIFGLVSLALLAVWFAARPKVRDP